MNFQEVINRDTRDDGKDRKVRILLEAENLEFTTKDPRQDNTCSEEIVG